MFKASDFTYLIAGGGLPCMLYALFLRPFWDMVEVGLQPLAGFSFSLSNSHHTTKIFIPKNAAAFELS